MAFRDAGRDKHFATSSRALQGDISSLLGANFGSALSSFRRSAALAALESHFVQEIRKISAEKYNFGADEVSKCSYPWWHELVLNVMTHSNVVESIPEQLGERFTRELYHHFGQPDAWTIFPDVLPALETLKAHRIPMAAISNYDERLDNLLVGLGLRDFFQVITASFHEEKMKHDAPIFHKTFKALHKKDDKVETHEFLHIGDHPRRDYKAAIAIGAQGKLVWRSSTESPQSDIRKEDIVPSLTKTAVMARLSFQPLK